MADTPFDLSSNNGNGIAPILTGIYDLIRSRGDTGGSAGLNSYINANPASGANNMAGTQSALASLMNLLQNPSSISSNPAYQAGLGFGTEAVNRGAGSSGMFNSGNRGLALEKFGQDYGMGFENQIYNQLLGGVNANVGVGQLGLQTQNQGFNQQFNTAQLSDLERMRQTQSVGSGIGGIANGVSGVASLIQRLMGGGGGGFNLSGNVGGGLDTNWLETMFPGGSSGDITAGLNLDPGADWGSLFAGLGGP